MGTERYVFTAEGQGQVIRAYESIGEAADRTAEKVERAMRGGRGPSVGRGGAVASPATDRRRREDRELELLERRLKREIAAEERAEAKKEAVRQRSEAKAAAAKERAAAAERRREDKSLATLEKRLRREMAAEERAAATVARTRLRAAERAQTAAARRRERFREGALGMAREAAFSTIAAGGSAYFALTGKALREGVDLQDRATRLAIQGGDPTQGAAIRAGFENTAVEVRGSRADDIAGGVEAFVGKTGNVQVARDLQRIMAEVSVASGSSATDLGSAMADLYEKFEIRTPEEMSRAVSTLYAQGKKGSFELKDAASQYPKLAAAAQRLGIGKGADSVAVLGGLTQIARTATGSPEQAATALEATFRQLTAKTAELKSAGVNVFDKKGNARDIRDVLVETVSKVGGDDIEKKKVGLQKIFGEEGIRAVSPLISKYAEATGSAADKVHALRDMLNDAIDVGDAETQMREDMAASQGRYGAQLTAVWEQLKASVTSQAMPAVVDLVSGLSDAAMNLDFDALAMGTVALVEAFAMLVDVTGDVAEFLGLGKKSGPPEERFEKASMRVRELSARRDALLNRTGTTDWHYLNETDRIQYEKLTKQLNEQKGIRDRADAELTMAQSDPVTGGLQGTISRKDFVEKLTALGSSEMQAQMIADRVTTDPLAYSVDQRGGGDLRDVPIGNQDTARTLLQNFVESQQQQQAAIASDLSDGAGGAAKEINAQMGLAAQAAKEIASALSSADQRRDTGSLGL